MNENKLNEFKKYLRDNYQDAYISCFHGCSHWERVEAFGLLMAKENKDADTDVIRWFAWLHDSQRFDPYANQDNHGRIAARFVRKLRKSFLSDLSDEQIEKLQTACRIHPVKTRSGDITVDLCLDADRLDLPRVGYTTDPNRMASETGAKYARNSYSHNLKLIGKTL